VRVSCQRGDLRKRRIPPDADLVLGSGTGEPVCADQFVGGVGPDKVADLSRKGGQLAMVVGGN
jgi:hypothetical protein